jgi:transcriptional regulator with GAF, ATPase, and Fis domain
VNCCAISEGLFESELFGHVRGAFSGAVSDRQGLFEVANNGTIFLDEIGDISPNIQMKLLRAIQEREIRRVGENKVRYVNVRIIAATNRNLEEAVQSGLFREDLYYRLNVIPISLPKLKDRLSDIPLLANHFLKKHSPPGGAIKELSPEALKLLQSYHYPGNVRELENIIQRTVSFCPDRVITEKDISSDIPLDQSQVMSPGAENMRNLAYHDLKNHIKNLERDYLLYHLKTAQGNVQKAAKAIGITRTAFHNKIKNHAIVLEEIRKE